MVEAKGSTLHPLYFHLLKHLYDGERSPSIGFPSFQSISNDGEHSPSFLSSSPFKASTMIKNVPYPKILHFPQPTANLYLTNYGQKKVQE
jgi:hypothetical protein